MSEHATRTIVYTVTGQQISCDYAAPSAVNESCRYLQAMFSVDDTWSGLRIEAIFYNRSVMADPVELDESMICEVPAVVLQKPEREFYCGIVGYGDDGYRLTSDSIGVDLDGAAYTHGRTPSQPDPDLYARILEGLNKKLDANQGKENKGKALIINDDGDIVPGEVQDTTDHPLYLCQLSTAAPFTLDHTYAEVVEADAAGYAVAAKWGKYIFTLRTVSDTVAQFACADLEFRDYGVTLLTFNLPADGTEVNGIYAKVPFAGAEAGGVICADDATEADTVPARIGEDGKLYVAPADLSDAVKYTPEERTEAEQMQARANLGMYRKSYVYPQVYAVMSWGGQDLDKTVPESLPETARIVVDGIGEFETEQQSASWSISYVGDGTCYWHGNSNLLNNVPGLTGNNDNFSTFNEQKYADLPFVVYRVIGDTLGGTGGVILAEGVSMERYTFFSVYDTANPETIYETIPPEYLPPMTGATETEAGAAGLVPAPAAGEQDMVLHGDGTWRFPLPAVTADSNGAFLRVVDGAWAAEMLTDVSKEGA